MLRIQFISFKTLAECSEMDHLAYNEIKLTFRPYFYISICPCKIDLLAILQKSLDRAIFLYNFIHEAPLSGVRASIVIVHIRKPFKL